MQITTIRSDGMMTAPRTKKDIQTVNLLKPLYQKIAEQARKKGSTTTKYVNDTLTVWVDREIVVENYHKKYLSCIATQDKSMFISDSTTKKVAEVQVDFVNHSRR